MKALVPLAALILVGMVSCAWGAEVVRLGWETKHGSPPPALGKEAEALLPAFRIGLATLKESAVIQLALAQPAVLGLTAEQSAVLRPRMVERYKLIAESPAFAKASSLLEHCLHEGKAARGAANLYVPDRVTAQSPVIVFVHGYGGSFLWYQHWLAETFPGAIILCPAYGITTASIPAAYVKEALAAAAKQLGFALQPANLIGLSAGGFGVCRVFAQDKAGYVRMVCMAAYPPEETLPRFQKDNELFFVAGSTEFFVTNGQLARGVRSIRRYAPEVEMQTVPGGDHFFTLTHPEVTRGILKRWLGEMPETTR